MGTEREDRRTSTVCFRRVHGSIDHRPMTQMHPVKHADREMQRSRRQFDIRQAIKFRGAYHRKMR